MLTPEQIEKGLEMGRRFHAHSPYRTAPWDEEAVRTLFAALDQGGYIDIRENGMIGGLLTPMFFSRDTVVATELFWWSESAGVGRELREGFERWAHEAGAAYTSFSALANGDEAEMRARYRARGYEAVEVGFRKAL